MQIEVYTYRKGVQNAEIKGRKRGKMKVFGFEIVNNRQGKFIIVDIKKRIREVYIKGNSEAAYAAYRAITGATIFESWRVVKPWIKIWEGKTE